MQDVEAEYNVELPQAGFVYYDTVLDGTITVRDVDDDDGTVTYQSTDDDFISDRSDRFLAWLAAERFVKLGERTTSNGVMTTADEVARVFAHRFGYDPRDHDRATIWRSVLGNELGQTLQETEPELTQ